MNKFECPHCGFKAKIISEHRITYCPNCQRNQAGQKHKTAGQRFQEFTNWMMTPQTVFRSEKYEAEGADEMRAIAEIKKAEAELERARKGPAQQVVHQHLHITPKQLSKLKQKLIRDGYSEERLNRYLNEDNEEDI